MRKDASGPTLPQLLAVEQVAAQLGVTALALRNDRGHRRYELVPVDGYVKLGARLRIRADRLAAHVAACTTSCPAPVPLAFQPPRRKRRA